MSLDDPNTSPIAATSISPTPIYGVLNDNTSQLLQKAHETINIYFKATSTKEAYKGHVARARKFIEERTGTSMDEVTHETPLHIMMFLAHKFEEEWRSYKTLEGVRCVLADFFVPRYEDGQFVAEVNRSIKRSRSSLAQCVLIGVVASVASRGRNDDFERRCSKVVYRRGRWNNPVLRDNSSLSKDKSREF